MKYEFNITYLSCQSCTAKIHCDDCADKLRERLEHERGISAVEMDIPKRSLYLCADGWDEDDLLDILEEAGIFAD